MRDRRLDLPDIAELMVRDKARELAELLLDRRDALPAAALDKVLTARQDETSAEGRLVVRARSAVSRRLTSMGTSPQLWWQPSALTRGGAPADLSADSVRYGIILP